MQQWDQGVAVAEAAALGTRELSPCKGDGEKRRLRGGGVLVSVTGRTRMKVTHWEGVVVQKGPEML